MGELMRRREYSLLEMKLEEEAARERVVTMRVQAHNGKLRRDAWEHQLCQLMVDGCTRRGHLLSLVTAEALREVGFAASELLASGFQLLELLVRRFAFLRKARNLVRRRQKVGPLLIV